MADANAVLSDINKFNKEQMNHVEVTEKSLLPDKDQVEIERKEVQLRQEIEKDHQLNHVKVEEKVQLPSPDDIAQEKQEQQLRAEIEGGGHSLKHVDPCVRNSLPDADTIAQEKKALGQEWIKLTLSVHFNDCLNKWKCFPLIFSLIASFNVILSLLRSSNMCYNQLR